MIFDIYKDAAAFDGRTVTVSGWVRTARDSKAFGFIELNDGTCFRGCQIVLEADAVPNFAEVIKIGTGSALTVTGKVVATPGNQQPFEIKAAEAVVDGAADPEYPMQKKRHSLEFLREQAYLRPRTNTFNAVFRVRSACAFAIHKFFNERRFVYVHTPIVTASDCEGAGEMFRATTLDLENPPRDEAGKIDFKQDFFGKSAFLTVSGQLNVEPFALAFSNVYTFGPTFRAENSNTARHAAEFWMIEPEIAFAGLTENMRLAEDMVKYVIRYVMEHCPDEMDFFNKLIAPGLFEKLENIVGNNFAVLPYADAVKTLEKVKAEFEYPVFFGCDLQSEHERYLTEKVFGKPVFLINYPKEIKAFYMRLNDDNRTVAAMDMLVPGIGELIGGSQREERPEVLSARLAECSLRESDYTWYMNLRKYGGCKHAGYGLGFERMIMYLTGMSNIRDVIPYPRTVGNCEY